MKVGCPVEEEKEFLLVAQRPNILRIDLRNLSNVDVLPLTQIKNVIALEFDLQENCVIYGDIELDKIFIQCLNGTPPRVLVENNLSVEGEIFFTGERQSLLSYSGDPRSDHLKTGSIQKPDVFEIRISNGPFISLDCFIYRTKNFI